MSGGNDDSDGKPKSLESGKPSQTPSSAVSRPSMEILDPELFEVLRQEGQTKLDVNVLVLNLTNKAPDPTVALENIEKMLAITAKYEDQKLEQFKRKAQAVIELKTNDPDEIQKRKDAFSKRVLRYVLAGCALLGLGGGVVVASMGGSMFVAGMLIVIGALPIALIGPISAGESVSVRDVVRVLKALPRITAESGDEKKSLPPGKGAKR